MTISSLIVEVAPGKVRSVEAQLASMPGVEVSGVDEESGKVVVVLEAPGIGASHDTASSFVRIDGVTNVNLVYANFEDDVFGSVPPGHDGQAAAEAADGS